MPFLRFLDSEDIINAFEPENTYILFWNFFNLFSILFNTIYIPLSISFSINPKFNEIINILFSIIFFLDVLIKLNTGIYRNGFFEKDKIEIYKNYFKKHLFYDFLTYFPFFLNLFTNFSYIKFLFLIRTIKLKKFLWKLDEYLQLEYSMQGFFNLMKLIAMVLILAHIFGCLFHYVAVYEISNGYSYTWLHSKNIQNSSYVEKYLDSLYFSVVTMITVGYGDISPVTSLEKLFCIIMMLFAGIVYGFVINSIGHILMEFSTYEAELKYFFFF